MHLKILEILNVSIILIILKVGKCDESRNNVFDWELYKRVLDPQLCQQQLEHTAINPYVLDQFLDAGIRIPRGVLLGNFVDLGNYFQCLNINEPFNKNNIEGKYCMINVPFVQDNVFKEINEIPELRASEMSFIKEDSNNKVPSFIRKHLGTMQKVWSENKNPYKIENQHFKLALCIPKSCTSEQAVDFFYNFTAAGFQYTEQFCRLPNDKPWVTSDYMTIGIFALIGVLTLLSTIYDVRTSGRDPKLSNMLCKSFSLYANLQRLTTYEPKAGVIECLDGIRACAMIWVIIGHTGSISLIGRIPSANILNSFQYIISKEGLWISAAPITVDSFLVLSGLLVVYVIRGKFTSMMLLKNIHVFYINRLLRMFPSLAIVVLLQASLFNRIVDGPYWETMAVDVQRCRTRWWYTLLYIQNFFDSAETCLAQSWYLAVDVQLHILSPLVLFWLLSKRRLAWKALVISLVISIIGAAIYNFIMKFPSGTAIPTRMDEFDYFYQYYYFNTFTRASPFFIGMACGYILSLCRKRTVNIPKILVCLLWFASFVIAATVIYSSYPIVQMDWDNQFVDSVINSFAKPLWALSLSWLIFACVHGYGGTINSFLSHRLWKLPARLSYGMYLFHYPIIGLVNGTALTPWFFTVPSVLFRFFGILSVTMGLSFITTVLVDIPFSELVRLVLTKSVAKKQPRDTAESEEK